MAIPSAAGGHAGRLKETPSPSAPLEWRRQTRRTLHAQQQSQHRLDSRSKADEASATTGKPQGYLCRALHLATFGGTSNSSYELLVVSKGSPASVQVSGASL